MFALLSFLIFFLSSILQLTIIPRLFGLTGVLPNLVLVLVILWSVFFGFKKSFWLAIFVGFLLDLFSGSFFGTYIILFLLIAFIADLATEYIFRNNLLLSSLTLSIIFTIIINFLLNYLSFKVLFSGYKLFYIFGLTIFFNLLLTISLFPLINMFKNKIALYQKKEKLPY